MLLFQFPLRSHYFPDSASPADMDLLHDLCHSSSHIRLTAWKRSGDTNFVRYSAAVAWESCTELTTLSWTEARARFIREARTAGKLSHENIMVIHDLGEIDGKTYIVMEYLIGKDLRSIIDAKEPLSLREKLNYAQQICRGLQYAHANLIIHRDIKPENIKVLGDGRVKVMDFGIAKPTSPVGEATTVDAEEGLTRVGMRIGTPWYMSPEQVKGTRVDKRADIFSFGVVLYELLTYRKPFEGDDTTVLYKILHEEPPPLLIEESGLTSELQRILSRCLAKDPEARYADCRLVDRDLELVASKPVDAGAVQQLMAEGEKLAEENRLGEATRCSASSMARSSAT